MPDSLGKLVYRDLRLGLLGGGQLGRMLLEPCRRLNVHTAVLDPDADAPARTGATSFAHGNFADKSAVLAFGRQCDVLTVEIEHVHVEALRQLQEEGVHVHPSPDILATVQDKGAQKQFYQTHGIPTAAFRLVEDPRALPAAERTVPAVLKLRRGGYDGRGVHVVRTAADWDAQPFGAPCVLEEAVAVQQEIAVLVARNPQGQTAVYPPVEMAFHPTANLVELLFAPANLDPAQVAEAQALALRIAKALDLVGLLAVELFVDAHGRLLVNEIAPRPHNSGHHTIEACATSQFEQHLRAVLGLPLGSTAQYVPAVMLNLLGAPGADGLPVYEGLNEALRYPGVHVHLYGKQRVSPMRKMGHVTVTAAGIDEALRLARQLQPLLRVTGQDG